MARRKSYSQEVGELTGINPREGGLHRRPSHGQYRKGGGTYHNHGNIVKKPLGKIGAHGNIIHHDTKG